MPTVHIEQDGVDAFEPQITRLLELLGQPEALVTDLSQFSDFICMFDFPNRETAQAELDRLMSEGNVPVKIKFHWTFIEACREILKVNPNWPKSSTIN